MFSDYTTAITKNKSISVQFLTTTKKTNKPNLNDLFPLLRVEALEVETGCKYDVSLDLGYSWGAEMQDKHHFRIAQLQFAVKSEK